MNLPPTYYDVLINREIDRSLVIAARKDIEENREGGPFLSTDAFSKHFDQYAQELHEQVGYNIQKELQSAGVSSPSQIENRVNTFFDSPDFKKMLYLKTLDYLTLVNFELFGKKTFYISTNLAEQLAITDLEIDSEFLKLPFDSCLFVLSGHTALRALYVTENRPDSVIDFKTPVSVFANSVASEVGGRKIVFACWHANRTSSHFFIKRELLIRPGWKIADTLRTDWSDIYRGSDQEKEPTINEIIHGAPVDDSPLVQGGIAFFRIVLNAILYMGCNDAETIAHLSPHPQLRERLAQVKSLAKRKNIKSSIARSSSLDYSELGANVEPIAIRKPNVGTAGETSSGGAPLVAAKRFIVRGHWRNQPHGEKGEQRKLIWIRPYYKGPELAELVNKPYIAK